MSAPFHRRDLLKASTATLAGVGLGCSRVGQQSDAPGRVAAVRSFRLGMITYNVAHDWDLETILENYPKLGLQSVEFRSTHRHGVEPTLTKAQRRDVRQRCTDAGVVIWCLGTACEYHAPDKAVVDRNIEETKQFIELAADLNCPGIKVRPNGLPDGVDQERTLEQIGTSLRIVGAVGADHGVGIWCEMHGRGTAQPAHMRRIMEIADHPNVGAVWNSNRNIDDHEGSIAGSFELMKPWIRSVHINELINGYPYRELFRLLNQIGYDKYTMIEAQGLKEGNLEDNLRFVRFYRALWDAWSQPV